MVPFQGEVMRCELCNRVEKSDPLFDSGWRFIELDGIGYYICPNEFPPDGSSAKAFKEAYVRILEVLFHKFRHSQYRA